MFTAKQSIHTLKNTLFNHHIAADVCGCDIANIKDVQIWYYTYKDGQTRPRVILVKFQKGSNRFVSVKAFYFVFKKQRYARGLNLASNKGQNIKMYSDGIYQVPSDTLSKCYVVRASKDSYSCNCYDFQTQLELGFKKPKCKHIYALQIAQGNNEILRNYFYPK